MILLYSEWRLQQESNLHFSLRRTTLYPFNYGADARNSNRKSRSMPLLAASSLFRKNQTAETEKF